MSRMSLEKDSNLRTRTSLRNAVVEARLVHELFPPGVKLNLKQNRSWDIVVGRWSFDRRYIVWGDSYRPTDLSGSLVISNFLLTAGNFGSEGTLPSRTLQLLIPDMTVGFINEEVLMLFEAITHEQQKETHS